MDQPQRKYGFPLRMLVGFAIGAGVAAVVAFVLAARAQRFSYTALFDLVVALGALGTYLGHVSGALKHKDAGFKPLGPITPNVLMVGGGIVLLGTAAVVGAVLGIMILIKGGLRPISAFTRRAGVENTMDLFPFSEADWGTLSEALRAVLNATLADDAVLRASHWEGVQEVLIGLRAQYGEHPLLLETEADFTHEPLERVALYERARDMALACGWPTLTIRIALARVLVEDLGRPREARDELLACRNELTTDGDESDHEEWSELLAECDHQSKPVG